MFEKMKTFSYYNILLSQVLFFSILSIVGITYHGSGESIVYTLYLVASSFLSYLFFFKEIIDRVTFKPFLLALFLIPIVFLLFYFLAPAHSFVETQTKLFFVLVLPASFIGYIVARTNRLGEINKGFILAASIVFLAVLRILPRLVSLPVIELMDVFGGGQYQAFSYSCAFSFLIFLRHFFSQRDSQLWRRAAYSFILMVLFVGVILSGGRGGLMVVFSGSIILTIRRYGLLKFVRYLLYSLIFIISLLYFSVELDFPFSERLSESFERLFSFISMDGVNMEGTSNRDSFYGIALQKIGDSVIWGYGLFGLVDELGEYYPHNIFLEILLQGGMLYLLFFLCVMSCFFYKLIRLIREKSDHDIILIPTIYSFVLLMFSSSYLQEPFFWFSLSYVFSHRAHKLNYKTIEDTNTHFRISKPQ